ncbi:MAG: T9SS type A sorting domain-containing protein, partial [Bacteroidota bacterium]|nr:T9SS type A sorting domain-containing protein [Bacteroidota bacterium]
ITQPDALAIDEQVTNSLCGGASGAIDITVSGGTDPYDYDWSTGATSEDVTGLSAGTYTVTVTDENGCSVTESFNVDDAGAVEADASGTDVSCNGGNNGSADLVVSGGTDPYVFDWSNGATTEDISGLVAGTYTVTITDLNGCTAIATVTINEPVAIEIIAEGVCSPCKKNGEAYASASASGGTGQLSYLWSTGATTAVINNLESGTYTVTVTDENGCSATEEVILDCDPECQYTTFTMGGWGSPPNGNNPGSYLHANFASAYPAGLVVGCNNTLSLSSAQAITNFLPSGSTASQLPPGALINPGGAYNNVLAGQLVAASLNVRFDAVDPNFSPEISNLGNLEIAYGDFAGWTVLQLLDSANNFIGACGSAYSANQYNVALSALNETFDNGNVNEGYLLCSSEELYAYTNSTDVSCDKVCDGTAEVFASLGTAPYSYLWSTGATTAAVIDLCEGIYTVTVTDANECQLVLSVTIDKNSAQFYFDFVVTDVTCNGEGNGMIDLTVTGGTAPYQYLWSNGAITEDIANLDAGPYTVTVTDSNGCTDSDNTLVEEPSLLVALVTKTDITCEKADNGVADLTASGGTGPYSYLWSNGETTEDISGLVPGIYTVTVTDANDCTASASVMILEISSWMYISYDVSHVTCHNTSTGAIDATISGGISPYTYLWSNGATTEDISGVPAGIYTLTVTDSNGCSNSKTTYVNNGRKIVARVTKVKAVCGINGSIDLTVTGGTAPYTYLWSNGATTQDIGGLTPGNYTVTITDNYGCIKVFTTKVWGAAPMKIRLLSQIHTSDNVCDGALDIKVNFGTPPYSYIWNNGATTQDLTNLCTGVYKVTVTDAEGCTATKTWRILYAKDVNPVRLSESTPGSRDISLMGVYPSPASETATVRVVFDKPGKADITIVNLLGKVEQSNTGIQVEEGITMDVKLDVSNLSSGTYVIAVTQNGVTVHEKLQIVR